MLTEDQERFNELKVQFGSEGRADQLTFEQFTVLPDEDARFIINRIEDFPTKGELWAIKKRAKQTLQGFPQAGKY
jgi:hypothetical protein